MLLAGNKRPAFLQRHARISLEEACMKSDHKIYMYASSDYSYLVP
jgi:hypothetical protein